MVRIGGNARESNDTKAAEPEALTAREALQGILDGQLAPEELEASRMNRALAVLKEWKAAGMPRLPLHGGTSDMARFGDIVGGMLDRGDIRRALGVPNLSIEQIKRRAKTEEEERAYQRKVLRPLLDKAREQSIALKATLDAIAAAEEIRPELQERKRQDAFLAALEAATAKARAAETAESASPTSPPAPQPLAPAGSKLSEDARANLALAMSDPQRMREWLVWLAAILKWRSRQAAGAKGRPPDLVKRRVEEAVRKAAPGISDRSLSLLLRAEGIEDPAGDMIDPSVDAGRARVKSRRKRGTKIVQK